MLLLLLKIWRKWWSSKIYFVFLLMSRIHSKCFFFTILCVSMAMIALVVFHSIFVLSSVPNFFIQGTDLLSPWSPHLPVSDLFSQLGIFILKMDRRAACYSFVLAFVWHNHEFLSLDKPCTFVKYACPIPCPKFWTNAYCFKMFVG